MFQDFLLLILCIRVELPIHYTHLARYIAYLVATGYSYNTIKSHVSVVNFVHRIRKLNPPGEEFLIRKLLIGVRNTLPLPARLIPIDITLLKNIVSASHIISNEFDRILFVVICTWLYHGCFRIGELLYSKTVKHIIKAKNINWKLSSFNRILGIQICMESFKFSGEHRTILLEPVGDKSICPILNFHKYLKQQRSSRSNGSCR